MTPVVQFLFALLLISASYSKPPTSPRYKNNSYTLNLGVPRPHLSFPADTGTERSDKTDDPKTSPAIDSNLKHNELKIGVNWSNKTTEKPRTSKDQAIAEDFAKKLLNESNKNDGDRLLFSNEESKNEHEEEKKPQDPDLLSKFGSNDFIPVGIHPESFAADTQNGDQHMASGNLPDSIQLPINNQYSQPQNINYAPLNMVSAGNNYPNNIYTGVPISNGGNNVQGYNNVPPNSYLPANSVNGYEGQNAPVYQLANLQPNYPHQNGESNVMPMQNVPNNYVVQGVSNPFLPVTTGPNTNYAGVANNFVPAQNVPSNIVPNNFVVNQNLPTYVPVQNANYIPVQNVPKNFVSSQNTPNVFVQNQSPQNTFVPAQTYPTNNFVPAQNYPNNNFASAQNYPNSNLVPVQNYPNNNFVPAQNYPNYNYIPVQNYPNNFLPNNNVQNSPNGFGTLDSIATPNNPVFDTKERLIS